MKTEYMNLVIMADIVGLFFVDDGWYDKLVSGTMKNRDSILLLLNLKLLNIIILGWYNAMIRVARRYSLR